MAERQHPRQQITEAQALRALAHPLRLRLMEALAQLDSATATELAERVGESPANCSWHLRLLAKHGYIEEAPGGTGRQRPWRPVVATRHWEPSDTDPELTAAGEAAARMLLDNEIQKLHEWQARRAAEPAEWRDAASIVQSVGWFTAAELQAVNEQIFELVAQHMDRVARPETRPAGARLARFVSWGIPATPPPVTAPPVIPPPVIPPPVIPPPVIPSLAKEPPDA